MIESFIFSSPSISRLSAKDSMVSLKGGNFLFFLLPSEIGIFL